MSDSIVFYGYTDIDKKKLFTYIEENITNDEKDEINSSIYNRDFSEYIERKIYTIECVKDIILKTEIYEEESYHILCGNPYVINKGINKKILETKTASEQSDKIKKLKKYLNLRSPTTNIVSNVYSNPYITQ